MVGTPETMVIRWVTRRDDGDVLRIEQCCYLDPLTHDRMITMLRKRSVIGIVAEDRGHVLGYCIYELAGFEIRILRMGVDPRERRNGVGTALIERLKSKLGEQQRRDTITIDTPGVSLAAQLFLSKAGFVAEARPGDVIRFTFDLEVDDD